MGYNVLICDDDRLSLKINQTYVEELSKKFKISTCLYCFNEIDDTYTETINKVKMDLILLDIDLKEINGLVLAKDLLKKNPWSVLIFITGYTEYALDAFDLLAFGYLAKPIDSSKFEKLFAKAIVQMQSVKYKRVDSLISFTIRKKQFTLRQTDIIYIEKVGQKIKIVTMQEEYEIYDTVTSLENKLGYLFLRISSSTIVNMQEIAILSSRQATLKTGENLIVGRTYSKRAKSLYSKFPKS
ncbi:LytR/AlgR family response regulator transcription factor [Anaeromicropila populeti]|uniref:Stage 0 sporulation protein A homolog n=1 Tax=Anaeromicropila populeti TaxID=37658 RepID=A0A1I6J2B4_9FIRM|nr:LytTR family DNA-binding domain-containing protein [Anaeromicropila populeti]SFR73142.1 two component transcriptional regulator, LytTR family [Anaeromicropila populeti]